MKDFILKIALLPVLGFVPAGCEIIHGPAEDGAPYADFEVYGKITDSELQQPIFGITVAARDNSGFGDVLATTTTDQEGRYELKGSFFPSSSITIAAIDTDGEDNGGKFSSTGITVRLEKDSSGSDGWYSGKYTAEQADLIMYRDISSDW